MRVEKMWNIGEASCSGREKPPKVHFKCSRCNRMIEQDYRAVEGDRELYNWLIARGMLFDSNGKRLLADAMLEVKPRQESDEEDLLEVSNPNQLP